MSGNDKRRGVVSSIVINSVAAAIAYDKEKGNSSSVIIAYSKGDTVKDISFVAIKAPKKNLYDRNVILDAICCAENVKYVTYVDYDGTDKDIYILRPKEGEIFDFVNRDTVSNRYVEGFAEIESSILRFSTNRVQLKYLKKLDISVTYSVEEHNYEQNSVQYAIVNAYNACLIGRLFSRDEFRLETGDGRRAKLEIRTVSAKFVDISTIYLHPEFNEGDKFVSSYITEPMNIINGDEMLTRVYRIAYRVSFNGYYITRVN